MSEAWQAVQGPPAALATHRGTGAPRVARL